MMSFASALFRRKRALRFFTGALLSLCVAGCMRNEPSADLRILNGAEPESLDPAIVTGQPDGRVVFCLFEGLTRLDPEKATPIPALAERWDISPDAKTYTFYLRSNLAWSTGEPITADDLVYSWQRVVNPETAADYAGQLFFVKNAEAITAGKIKDLTQLGVKALNRHTVEVQLIGPTPFFLDLCAFRTLAVVPRHWIEKHQDKWITAQPLPTSGPYTLDFWRIGEKIRVRRNPRYWDTANVRNEIVDFIPLDRAGTALNLYDTGQADIIWDKNLIPTELMDVLKTRKDCNVFSYLGNSFVRFNTTRKPFNDVRVRQALALCVDKRRIVERITRAGELPAETLVPPGTANYTAPAGLGFDPDRARKLLEEAGYPGGKDFPTFHYLFNSSELNKQIAVELQSMWKRELGITMELRQTEWKVYLAAQSQLDYDTSRSSWIGDYNDPNTFLDMFMSENGNNRTGWKNARYDELMRTGNSQIDKTLRAKTLAEAEKLLIADEMPIIPVYFYMGVNFFNPDKIGGVYNNLLDEHPVWAIYRKDKAPGTNAIPD
jgi:oligopeptide transport system substrate-binding protein